ncbi:MAG: DUF998 domain-containing protein [Pseudomonadota bacterium]
MNTRQTLSERLIGQGWVAAAAMALMVALSLFDPLHDPLTQHMSEMVDGSWWSAAAIRVLPTLAGLSVLIFGLGCWGRRGFWTGLTSVLFGAAMISNGIIPTGSPWHGLYGLAVFSVLVPACFAAEFPLGGGSRWLSLAVAFAGLVYLWAMVLVGLEPPEYRGVTQRVFSLIAFGWFAIASRARIWNNGLFLPKSRIS